MKVCGNLLHEATLAKSAEQLEQLKRVRLGQLREPPPRDARNEIATRDARLTIKLSTSNYAQS